MTLQEAVNKVHMTPGEHTVVWLGRESLEYALLIVYSIGGDAEPEKAIVLADTVDLLTEEDINAKDWVIL